MIFRKSILSISAFINLDFGLARYGADYISWVFLPVSPKQWVKIVTCPKCQHKTKLTEHVQELDALIHIMIWQLDLILSKKLEVMAVSWFQVFGACCISVPVYRQFGVHCNYHFWINSQWRRLSQNDKYRRIRYMCHEHALWCVHLLDQHIC